MFNHKIGFSLTNVIVSSSVSLGAIATIGIVTNPVMAADLNGVLSWSNGTVSAPPGNVFSVISSGMIGDTFDITFSPGMTGAFVTTASGDFAPFFPLAPAVFPVSETATFQLTQAGVPDAQVDLILSNDLVFDFGDVSATLLAGTEFLGLAETVDGAIEVELFVDEWIFNIDGEEQEASSSTFEFGIPGGVSTGDYSGTGVLRGHGISIPEPGTVLGLLTVGTLGLLAKLKKQV